MLLVPHPEVRQMWALGSEGSLSPPAPSPSVLLMTSLWAYTLALLQHGATEEEEVAVQPGFPCHTAPIILILHRVDLAASVGLFGRSPAAAVLCHCSHCTAGQCACPQSNQQLWRKSTIIQCQTGQRSWATFCMPALTHSLISYLL